ELMRAAAFGELQDGDPDPAWLRKPEALLRSASDELEQRRRAAEVDRRAANEALVDARISDREDGVELKLVRAHDVMAKVRDSSIRRLYEGRIRNLSLLRDDIRAELDTKRGLSITTQPVAVAVLEIVDKSASG